MADACVATVSGRANQLLPFIGSPRVEEVARGRIEEFEGRDAGGSATAYVCRGFVCEAPTTDADRLR